jgi:hypothetical protein
MSSARTAGSVLVVAPATHGVSRAANQPMSAFLIQTVFLAAGAAYFGWTAAGALRSGEITVYVRPTGIDISREEPIPPATG